MKERIKELIQTVTKAMKPFLEYFIKCTFPRQKNQKFFHIIGVDIIFDEDCQPWLLELNGGPSFNIENPMRSKEEGSPKISEVDLHVKSMVMGHAVKLCLKKKSIIDRYEEYDSYTQIYSPDIDQEKFQNNNILDGLYSLFGALAGQSFYPTLTMMKFTKINKILKLMAGKDLKKYELEIIYKKLLTYHDQMDFYCFLDGIDKILDHVYENNSIVRYHQYQTLIRKFELIKDRINLP